MLIVDESSGDAFYGGGPLGDNPIAADRIARWDGADWASLWVSNGLSPVDSE